MKCNTHVEHFIQKTKWVFGLLRSTLAGAPLQVKLLTYKILWKPIIEYSFEGESANHLPILLFAGLFYTTLGKHIHMLESLQTK